MRNCLICLIVIFLPTCTPLPVPTPVSTQFALPSHLPDEIQSTATATQGDIPPMPSVLPTPSASNLQSLIDKAKEDLAQRISIPMDQIHRAEITEVEWSDSCLGCPQPRMDYFQVIMPGYRIILEADQIRYEYHSSRTEYVLYCENPEVPNSPSTP